MLSVIGRSSTRIGSCLLAGALLACLSGAAAAAGLFSSAEPRAGALAMDGREVVRSRYVTLDLNALPGAGEKAVLNMFEGLDLPVTISRVEDAWGGGRVHVGTIDGRPHSMVIISVFRDAVAMDVRDDEEHLAFTVQPAGDRLFAVSQVDEGALDPCSFTGAEAIHPQPEDGDLDPGAPGLAGQGVAGPDGTTSVIDLVILYTPLARTQAGGTNGMVAVLNGYITYSNNVYNNTNINQQVRLVHNAETPYAEAASMGTDLNRFASNGDGFMDEIHTLRNTFGGDLCHLITGVANGACGIAQLGGASPGAAFGVTARTCGAATFCHELGHNMGCCHAFGDGGGCTSGGIFCYSLGWRSSNNQYRTIMAYDPGQRIAYFSSPLITLNLNGTNYTIGVPEVPGCSTSPNTAADNARTINITRTNIANYRPTQVGNNPPSPFALSTPTNNAIGIATGPVFGWNPATGANNYAITVSPNPDLSDAVLDTFVLTVNATIPIGSLMNSTNYWWTVTAANLGGQTQTSSGIWTFRTRPQGDANGNGVVDFADLNFVVSQFGQVGAGLFGDVNYDNTVNFADLNIVLSNYGQM